MKVKKIAYSGVVAALYVALFLLFQPISVGPVQFRIAEAFTVLPFLSPVFIPGLFIGVFLSNIFSGLGPWDIYFGSFLTLLAAFLTWKMPKKFLAPLPPVLINAFGVSLYVSALYGVPYFYSVLWIGIGEAVVTYLIGIPVLNILKKYF
ncbi:MAG TPA: QueT transporter family protein [Tepiditoga sp.]|jgi:uncharacterized membrane protein|nr:QueT transporter family protein [Thermotogota bacterium]HOO73672.1 QueT transporter family protein [Tepiditoga sp.]